MKSKQFTSNFNLQWLFFLFLGIMVFAACSKDAAIDDLKTAKITPQVSLPHGEIIARFQSDYVQMQEQEIAINRDSSMYAQYASPTDRYKHGALGDYWEAAQLIVYFEGSIYEITLNDQFVFEDIRPRLFDVDNDSIPELITIRSKVGEGAGIAIYKITENGLMEYAFVDEIGTANRWLNIAAIYDMDDDGITELLWVQTPHIGGILKGDKITPGQITASDQVSYYSNHQSGLLNLCLSVVTFEDEKYTCYVPNQSRNIIAGFTFKNGTFQKQQEIQQNIDFSVPLVGQYPFCNVVSENVNCIAP